MLYLKIINIFLKKYYASYSNLSKELKNSIKIKVGKAVLELLIQKQHFDCFDLYNLKTAWPTKILMPFFQFLEQNLIRCLIYFLKKFIILR